MNHLQFKRFDDFRRTSVHSYETKMFCGLTGFTISHKTGVTFFTNILICSVFNECPQQFDSFIIANRTSSSPICYFLHKFASFWLWHRLTLLKKISLFCIRAGVYHVLLCQSRPRTGGINADAMNSSVLFKTKPIPRPGWHMWK